jgi:polysaccharide pyruvyl transferase WcaK-like protein
MINQVPIFIKSIYYGPHNIGDDALMLVVCNLIKKVCPANKIGIGVMRPEIVKSWLPGIRVFNTADYQTIKANILVYGGGGQFFSFPTTLNRKSYLIQFYQKFIKLAKEPLSIKNICSVIVARSHKTTNFRIEAERSAAFCVGVGPFVAKSPRLKKAKSILKSCDYLSVRDVESKNICQSWGINKVRLKTDACYLKDLWMMENESISITENKLNGSIGLVVRHWQHDNHGNRYIDSMLAATWKLRKMGFHAQFISFDKRHDAQVISKLKNQNETVIIYDPSITRPGQFMHQVASKFDLFLSARAHGIILPSIFGIPGICVGIEPKLINIHKSLPTGTGLWTKPFHPYSLVKCIKMIFNNLENYSHNIYKEAEEYCRIAKEESKYFLDWLKLVYDSSSR